MNEGTQYRVFAIPATGSSDLEEELNRFLRSPRVVSVQKTMEQIDGAARCCFCVEYLEDVPVGSAPRSPWQAATQGNFPSALATVCEIPGQHSVSSRLASGRQ